MTVVEFLAAPTILTPAMVRKILSGGVLERRFKMNVSSKPLCKTPHWALALVLVCAVGFLPLGVAYAQDFDAVGKRLCASVTAGELTPEQAKAMIIAVKKKAGGHARAVGMRLRKAVAAGELSAEQAEAMMGVLHKSGRGQKDVKEEMIAAHVRDYLAKLRTELGIAVRAGKMSREDAGKKYHAAEKTIKEKLAAGRHHEKKAAAKKHQGRDRARAYLIEVKKKLGAALEKGEISEEQARKKYEAVEKAGKERMDAARRARRDSHHERRGL